MFDAIDAAASMEDEGETKTALDALALAIDEAQGADMPEDRIVTITIEPGDL